jgi:RIO1 family
VTGEFRFRRGYSRNPRKMVRLWAEKEMRNLKRLVAAGIRAPDPIEVRENVLPMTFVGSKDGWCGVIHLLLGISSYLSYTGPRRVSKMHHYQLNL